MKRMGACVLLLAFCALPTGCASIVTGTSQMVEVHTEPKGAVIQMDGVHVGTTPRLLKMNRGGSHTLMVWKEGFEPETVVVGTEFNLWFLGNFMLGLLPGIVDIANGAWMWATPEVINVTLVTKREPPKKEAPQVPETPKPEENKPRENQR